MPKIDEKESEKIYQHLEESGFHCLKFSLPTSENYEHYYFTAWISNPPVRYYIEVSKNSDKPFCISDNSSSGKYMEPLYQFEDLESCKTFYFML